MFFNHLEIDLFNKERIIINIYNYRVMSLSRTFLDRSLLNCITENYDGDSSEILNYFPEFSLYLIIEDNGIISYEINGIKCPFYSTFFDETSGIWSYETHGFRRNIAY